MIEKLIFNLFSFALFIMVFINLVRKNDTNYVYILVLQAIGIFLNFIELMNGFVFNIYIKILMYIISIILPMIILLVEYKRNINVTELINILIADIIKIKNSDKAIKILNKVIKKYPNSIAAHKKLASIYEKEGKIDDAIREYEIALGTNYDSQIYVKIGKLYKQNGKNWEAKSVFEDILKEEPNNYDASISLGEILYEENELKNAVQVYNNILKYYPNDFDLHYALGMTYTLLNDFQKAKECYEMAAKINSLSYHSKYALAQICLMYEDIKEAEELFNECTDSEELDSKAYYYLARIAIVKGETDKAIKYLNLAIDLDYKLYDKVQSDNIFIAIRDKVEKSKEKNQKEIKDDLQKENKVEEHLEKTSNIVGKLKNDDIQMIENVLKAKKEKENKEIKDKTQV